MSQPAATRFLTLDVFRGMTICLMIIVNTQGSLAVPYTALEHAEWNGCTLADIVFPSFLFAVGNSLAFTLTRFASLSAKEVWYRILKRSALIFLIGYLLSWYPFIRWNEQGTVWMIPFRETRILSVLQRIAIAYGIAAFCVYYCSAKRIGILCVCLLTGYWILLLVFGDVGAPYTLEGNAVRKLDLLILGASHMYREKGIAFDPEGIPSTLPSIVNVLAGYLVAAYIRKQGKNDRGIAALLVTGCLLLLTGVCWNYFLPLNKKIWTSSFVIYTTAIDILAITILLYFIEMKGYKSGVFFFTVFGKNPLVIYLFSNLIGIFLVVHITTNKTLMDWLNEYFFQRIAPGAPGCLLFSVFFTLICWVFGLVLDKKQLYIRI